jgi:DNA-binding GntR family transcriptional regulator
VGISPDAPEPLWRQAASAISAEIARGELTDGARLPSERELSERLAISRVTVRRALKSLIEDGVLTASHGRGWYVAHGSAREFPNTLESFSETADRLGLEASSTVVRCETVPATLDEAERLHIAAGTALFRLERIRLLDGVPVAVDTSAIPASVYEPGVPGPDFEQASLFDCLTGAGVDLSRADATIEAREADADAAAHLGIAVGMPILEMRQVVLDRSGRPLLESTVRYAGARYRLRTSFVRTTVRPAAARATAQGDDQ